MAAPAAELFMISLTHTPYVRNERDILEAVERLEMLFHQSFPAVFVSVLAAMLLSTILWSVQDHSVILIWFSTLALFSLGRLVLFIRYRLASPKGEDVLAWQTPYFATLLTSTLTWGIGSVVIIPGDSLVYQIVILCFMVGLAGGAISTFSANRLVALTATATVLLPVTGWFLLQRDLLCTGLAISAILFFLSAI